MTSERQGVVARYWQTGMICYLCHPTFCNVRVDLRLVNLPPDYPSWQIKVVFGQEIVRGAICHGLIQLCIARHIAEASASTRNNFLTQLAPTNSGGRNRPPPLNAALYDYLSHYLVYGILRSPVCDRIHTLSRSDWCFYHVQKQSGLARSGPHSHGGMHWYQDVFSQGAFRM